SLALSRLSLVRAHGHGPVWRDSDACRRLHHVLDAAPAFRPLLDSVFAWRRRLLGISLPSDAAARLLFHGAVHGHAEVDSGSSASGPGTDALSAAAHIRSLGPSAYSVCLWAVSGGTAVRGQPAATGCRILGN